MELGEPRSLPRQVDVSRLDQRRVDVHAHDLIPLGTDRDRSHGTFTPKILEKHRARGLVLDEDGLCRMALGVGDNKSLMLPKNAFRPNSYS